ncbi:methylated-DNA--[protein]-cysteine S-methyltransferase [Marinibaculum pumilum]|uniref:Methylated-DNA--protein-cysteine methyltransferase n=1 Tax=Marinibaculum pumilum TaxID=1766165 RepID=A0ABV7L9C9_9PROT
MPRALFLHRLPTPIGEALALTDEAGRLRAFDWSDHADRQQVLMRRHCGPLDPEEAAAPAPLQDALSAYFGGRLDALSGLPWATAGTAFQRRVWQALTDIPPGGTLSYGALAARLGMPKASRAVGLANGSNPVGLVVPCHRVIGADGRLTGYGGGIARKRWLLRHEGAAFVDRV